MKNFLIKLFIKDYKNVKDAKVRQKYGTLASIFGIISNFIICIMKIILGISFHLISILGDGINNLSDAFTSIVSLIGFKLAAKPADRKHPFGHARIEYIASFIIAIFIELMGFELVIQSFDKILKNESFIQDQLYFIISIIILVFSIIIKLYQCYFNYSLGKTIKSSTLKLTATDSRNDVITSSIVLLGLIISYFTNINLDGYLGIVVGIFIIISTLKYIMEIINQLIGKSPDQEIIDEFIKKIKSYDEVLGIHDLQIHAYGLSSIFATCHVEIDAKKNVLESHELLDNIENAMLEEFNIHTVLHMDPVILFDDEQEKIKNDFLSVLKSFPFKLSLHDFRLVKGPTFVNAIFDLVIPDDMPISNEKLIQEIKAKAKQINPRYNCTIKIDQDFLDLIKEDEYGK